MLFVFKLGITQSKQDSLNFVETTQNFKISQIEKENQELKDELKEFKENISKHVSEVKSDTRDLINTYIIIFTALITIIGFLINFFGKKAIKERVEEIITETAKGHIETKLLAVLNSKVTDELIEQTIKIKADGEISKTVKSIEEQGNVAITEITLKGNEAINSLKSYPVIKENIKEVVLTDEDIQNNNSKQTANELFDLAYKSSDPRLQIELYNNVLKIEPKNIYALNNIGVAFNSLTRPEEALFHLNKAIELDSNYPQALTNRGQSHNLNGEFEKALKDLDKSINIDNDFAYSYAVKGNVLTKLSRFKEAEIILNKAVEINSTSGEAYFNRAFFFEERKQFSKSESDYKKAEELGVVNKAMLYNNLAVLYRRTKKFELAIENIERARQESPEFANIDGTLALIYADKGDDENFFKFLKIALEKGCKVWDYLYDPGFDKYRETNRLKLLIEPFQKKYFA